jgi:hypothetical protein
VVDLRDMWSHTTEGARWPMKEDKTPGKPGRPRHSQGQEDFIKEASLER